MDGSFKELKRDYAFERVEVPNTRYMQRLLDDAEALRTQIAELEQLRSSKQADFARLRQQYQLQALQDLYMTANYGKRTQKPEAKARLALFDRRKIQS